VGARVRGRAGPDNEAGFSRRSTSIVVAEEVLSGERRPVLSIE
jgi:hypothetical protein